MTTRPDSIEIEDVTDRDVRDTRAVRLEVRDNGDLAVICYQQDKDYPVTVTIGKDGRMEVTHEGGLDLAPDLPTP